MTESSSGSPGGSKGVAFTNWLVSKAAGVLERKSSRRGFIMGSAMVGSAVAVAGCAPGTQPGTPYNHITDCGGGLCTDGYTEFCCTINNGLNVCPPGTFVAGWWRADYSSFCNGTRYYMDCNAVVLRSRISATGSARAVPSAAAQGGATRGASTATTSATGSATRRSGSSVRSRAGSSPVCPPYTVAEYACTTAAAVDNSTAEHAPAHGCAPPAPPACCPSPSACRRPPRASSRCSTEATAATSSASSPPVARSFQGGQLGPAVTSAVTSASDATGIYAFGRGFGDALWWNRLANGAWSGPQVFGGVPLTSDPVAVTAPNAIYLFGRSSDNQLWHGHIDSGVWSGWYPMQGNLTSDVCGGVEQLRTARVRRVRATASSGRGS